MSFFFFFFNDTATTEIYTLSLHDALPISGPSAYFCVPSWNPFGRHKRIGGRSEEHTSELQSRLHLVCRLLLEKKKRKKAEAICDIFCQKFDNIAITFDAQSYLFAANVFDG